MQLDLDSFIEGTQSFRLREALWLPTWKIYVVPTPVQIQNIIKVAQPLQYIRNRYGKPLVITSWLRPQLYNDWTFPYGVGGAKGSYHPFGGAVDFQIVTMNCDEVRADLVQQLPRLKIRMERADGTNKIHIDIKPVPVGGNLYFYPPGSPT